jgi:hypothetical protein
MIARMPDLAAIGRTISCSPSGDGLIMPNTAWRMLGIVAHSSCHAA